MNLDLSNVHSVGDALMLLLSSIVVGTGRVLTTWWGATLLITVLVALVAAYVAPLGTDEDAPFLTEDERIANSSTIIRH